MTIQVTCQCGKQLSAKDEFAGKRVKCPGCGGPLVIPQPQPAGTADGISDLLDDAGMRAGITRCPGCGAELGEESVLCVMCGFDLRRGHRIKTRVGAAVEFDDEDLGDLPVHGVAQLDEAERRIARDKLEQKKMGKGAPWWLILIALLGVVGFGVGMYLAPQDKVMTNSGVVLWIAGALLNFWYGLRIMIEAFKESALVGILYLVLPFYALYFVISRWDRVGGLFLLALLGTFLSVAGQLMLHFGPAMQGDKKQPGGYSLRELQQRPAVVMTFQDVSLV